MLFINDFSLNIYKTFGSQIAKRLNELNANTNQCYNEIYARIVTINIVLVLVYGLEVKSLDHWFIDNGLNSGERNVTNQGFLSTNLTIDLLSRKDLSFVPNGSLVRSESRLI